MCVPREWGLWTHQRQVTGWRSNEKLSTKKNQVGATPNSIHVATKRGTVPGTGVLEYRCGLIWGGGVVYTASTENLYWSTPYGGSSFLTVRRYSAPSITYAYSCVRDHWPNNVLVLQYIVDCSASLSFFHISFWSLKRENERVARLNSKRQCHWLEWTGSSTVG